MEPATVAMILLSCGAQMQGCHMVDTRPAIYAGMDQCIAALPVRLEGTGMIGKCQPVTGVAPGNRVAMVRVTRGNGSGAISTDYLVQRVDAGTD
ncbi:hypothetical protein DPM33_32675 [Mesorhizobium hawassense]|uniref:Uncharacterized protein n=1 Tax=Mesorhizobium hawassense TaxID=1209954 RepID=A0A330H8Z1_9HYPH|nr:hypothetical protein [Mesorhizobium hawassense]RAZ83149.1 hypothetical protein DPM33_32675 [Mesorhizobium hawassense]